MKYFSVTTAFVLYYDVKHSDILWGSSQICCYLFVTKVICKFLIKVKKGKISKTKFKCNTYFMVNNLPLIY